MDSKWELNFSNTDYRDDNLDYDSASSSEHDDDFAKLLPGVDEEYLDDARCWEKPVVEWSEEETACWMTLAKIRVGQQFHSMKSTRNMSGKELFHLTKEQFIAEEGSHGELLYNLLHSDGSSIDSDTESEYNTEQEENPDSTENESGKLVGKLPKFIISLLHDTKTNPSIICWENYNEGRFRFVQNHEVARLWGSRTKANPRSKDKKMTYDNFSRALRYYYKPGIFAAVSEKRLVYQFGPNAKGWRTENPIIRL